MSERPRLRPDLVLVEQSYRGEQSYIVKDPSTRKYFRFRPVEIAVMHELDGKRTTAEAAAMLAAKGLKVSAAAIGKFADRLKAMGLVERTLGERSVLLMERLRAQRRQRLRQGPFKGDIFRLRWSMGDPDHFMDRTMPYLRFCFTRGFVLASLALFAVYFVILAVKWPAFAGALSDLYHFRMSAGDVFILWLTGTTVIMIHEFGHGYACKYFGGQVHEIGAMLLYFEPAFFCNVNDAWTFPELKARLWVTAAGSWIQMVVAGIAAIVWWAATPETLISQVALSAVLIGGITTVVVNLNPLIPLDGYYALSDWLEVPNLRQRAFGHLGWLVKRRLFRSDVPMPPADEREQRIFLVYGLLAAAYIGSILFFIGGAVHGWLSAALGGFGVALFLGIVYVMARDAVRVWSREAGAAWRRWRAGRSEGQRRRGPTRLAAGAAVVVLAGALVPRPITVTGGLTVAPASRIALVAPDTGVVVEVLAREGSRVAAGTPLARIRSFDLEHDSRSALLAADSLRLREGQARARGDEGDVARHAALRSGETARSVGLARRIESLTLRAPSPGVVLTARPEERVGVWVSIGDTVLELGDPAAFEARIALDDAGASQVRAGQRVRMVLHAGDGVRLAGTVGSVSEAAGAAGDVEGRVPLPASAGLRAGMTGEASVTLRDSNLWGALWWAVRRKVRTDILL
ncbi:MAG TPA: HlyD family efflux transporter periplasmic adaptor subunit [Gemmatimonadales bacterium]|nr:HlyD family efflux transporter periplasmic adaptor subunit [Gemmatimonadales bacterium]